MDVKTEHKTLETEKTFAELGYSHLDTAAMVTLLNRLLSSYSVYLQKLRNFHWNVTGQDFFDLHQLFEKMYKRGVEETDDLAERIRLFGQKPISTMAEYIQVSSINEEEADVTSFQMAKIVVADIIDLIADMEAVLKAANKINDNGTDHMIKSFIYKMEKEHWMLSSWIKQKI